MCWWSGVTLEPFWGDPPCGIPAISQGHRLGSAGISGRSQRWSWSFEMQLALVLAKTIINRVRPAPAREV